MSKKRINDTKKPLNPLIGLELTFSNKKAAVDIQGDGIVDEAAALRYKSFLDGMGKSFRGLEYYGLTAKADFVDTQKSLKDEQFSRDLRVGFFNQNEKEEVFWINVTRDPNVIEIQTKPVYVSELMNDDSPASLVLDHIFGKGRGLCNGTVNYGGAPLPASTQGGGHINVDAASSGLSDLRNVFELIARWELVKCSETNGLLVSESQTAARLADNRYFRCRAQNKFSENADNYSKNLLEKLENALHKKNPALDDIRNVYWAYPQTLIVRDQANEHFIPLGSMKQDDSELRICTHNQAINIEHLWDKDVRSRRVEFREPDAQKSREDVLGCWRIIEGTLLEIDKIKQNFCRLEEVVKLGKDEISDDESSPSSPSANISPSAAERVAGRPKGIAMSSSS